MPVSAVHVELLSPLNPQSESSLQSVRSDDEPLEPLAPERGDFVGAVVASLLILSHLALRSLYAGVEVRGTGSSRYDVSTKLAIDRVEAGRV
jgi:hypothetical protein